MLTARFILDLRQLNDVRVVGSAPASLSAPTDVGLESFQAAKPQTVMVDNLGDDPVRMAKENNKDLVALGEVDC